MKVSKVFLEEARAREALAEGERIFRVDRTPAQGSLYVACKDITAARLATSKWAQDDIICLDERATRGPVERVLNRIESMSPAERDQVRKLLLQEQ